MYGLYNLIAIPLLYLTFHFASLFSPKIRRGIRGRKHWQHSVKEQLQDLGKPRIWMHSSSYGEFLQGRPVLERLKKQRPDATIIVTFFSPSGYDNIRATSPVDRIFYLPFDTPSNAKRFIAMIDPAVAVIVRHDVWPNYVHELNRRHIPVVLIDASLPETSSRFWPGVRRLNRPLFSQFTRILPISQEEKRRFLRLGYPESQMVITGDTKYDQVILRAQNSKRVAHIAAHPLLQSRPVWVVGSSWPSDEKHVIPAFVNVKRTLKDALLIIAPHEVTEDHLQALKKKLMQAGMVSIRLSGLADEQNSADALIIDRVGLLANIYGLGQVAFVGGSMDRKVHNVLEPAGYGIPVLFGPCYHTQAEAVTMVESAAATVITNADEMAYHIIQFLTDKEKNRQFGERARRLVMAHAGAAEKTMQIILTLLSAARAK